jgi:single-strand selective monofunctional uracil DNA glycosylase
MIDKSSGYADLLSAITDDVVEGLRGLRFGPPVTHVYNPLIYARNGYDRYLFRYGDSTKSVILLGMNPGPFGMAQTGVPFGDVDKVSTYLKLTADIDQPTRIHPNRPISGFSCPRGEVSGSRLWGWVRDRYGHPDGFFKQFLVLNYCPLLFMESGGRNRTPDKLPKEEKEALFAVCDRALQRSVAVVRPEWVVGVGVFAEKRARRALADMGLKIGRITHPSPANPKANRGWGPIVERELAAMGIPLPR